MLDVSIHHSEDLKLSYFSGREGSDVRIDTALFFSRGLFFVTGEKTRNYSDLVWSKAQGSVMERGGG